MTRNSTVIPELLSPASDMDALRAAYLSGADAVYLGLQKYNARLSAGNFTFDQLQRALEYAHIRGKKIYVLFNTLLKDSEISEAYEEAVRCASVGADSIIVQDMGLASMMLRDKDHFQAKKFKTQIHASTQMTVYNTEGLMLLKDMGFDRVITERQLSLSEMKAMADTGIIDIECFCHGSSCMSVSGQCMMSSFIGGSDERSGNRGSCAQPCRKCYALSTDRSKMLHRLSPTELCSAGYLDKLVATGVCSLKIEGRLKSIEYVSCATRVYRESLDAIKDGCYSEWLKSSYDKAYTDLSSVFSRGSFSSGHHLGKLPKSAITMNTAGRIGLRIGSTRAESIKFESIRRISSKPIPRPFSIILNISRKNYTLFSGDRINIPEASVSGEVVNISKTGDNTYKVSLMGNYDTIKCSGSLSVYLSYNKKLNDSIHQRLLPKADENILPVDIYFTARAGNNAYIRIQGENGISVECQSCLQVLKAASAPLSEETLRSHLSKFGNSPFFARSVSIDMDDDIFMPISAVNEVRRRATAKYTEELLDIRAQETKASDSQIESAHSKSGIPDSLFKDKKVLNSYYFYTTESFMSFDVSKPGLYYIPIDAFCCEDIRRHIASLRAECTDKKIIASFPFICLGGVYSKLKKTIQGVSKLCDGFLLTNLGDYRLLPNDLPDDFILCSDYSMNVYNKYTFDTLHDLGSGIICLQPDMSHYSMTALAALCSEAVPEIIVNGDIAIMRSRTCVLASNEGSFACGNCAKLNAKGIKPCLIDEKKSEYPIICCPDDCQSIILGHSPIKYSDIEIAALDQAMSGKRYILRSTFK